MSYTVIYRTGGTENFKWHKCVPVGSHADAEEQKQEIERMGYKAIVHKTAEIESIGLPETYE